MPSYKTKCPTNFQSLNYTVYKKIHMPMKWKFMNTFQILNFNCLPIEHNLWPDFRKSTTLSHFETSNIYGWNKALHSTNQHYSELSFSLYHKLPEILWNILISVCVLLRQQGKVLGSIYFMRDKVDDFPKSGHIYYCAWV